MMKSLRFQLKNPHSSWFNQLFHHLLRPGRSSASYKSQRREMLRRAARCVRPGGVVARDHKGAADAGEMRFSVFFCVISYQPKYIYIYTYIYIHIYIYNYPGSPGLLFFCLCYQNMFFRGNGILIGQHPT